MPSDLTAFDLADMLRCGLGLRKAARGATTREEASQRIARFLYDELRDARTGERQCMMARVYVTHPYANLDAPLRAFADRRLQGASPTSTLRCLCLLATVGDVQAWNDRRQSRDHQAIPLASAEMVEQAPMIAQLVRQLGIDIATLLSPPTEALPELPELPELHGRSHGVFYVETAVGSPYIPAQAEFVVPYGVRSVVGFGGALPSSAMYAVILFSRVTVDRATADRFRHTALDMKSVMFGFTDQQTFTPEPAPPR